MSIETLITEVAPSGAAYAYAFESEMIRAGIVIPLEKAHFLAQVMHESSGLTRFVENMNYSAERLLQVFPRYFDRQSAKRYGRNPEMIGSRVYANRMGNGPESSGEGYKYRGHGAIQLTGHDNILAYSIFKYGDERVLDNPRLLTLPEDAAGSAVWFWETNGCGPYALANDIVAVSGIINVGTPRASAQSINGLDDRIRWLQKIEKAQVLYD